MATVTLGVSSLDGAALGLGAAFRGVAQEPRIDFVSAELLWRVLTPERWELLRALTGEGPMSSEEVAARVGRDSGAVRTDAIALAKAGVLQTTVDGEFHFPYDAIHVDFTITKAA